MVESDENGNGRVKLLSTSPLKVKRRARSRNTLSISMTPGVAHRNGDDGDILRTVRALRERGVEFLRACLMRTTTFWPERAGTIEEDLAQIKELGIPSGSRR